MAYIDAGTASMLVIILFFMVSPWILNLVATWRTWKTGNLIRIRFILHIGGIFYFPLGAIMGLIWLFKWRKSDGSTTPLDLPPPPPSPNA